MPRPLALNQFLPSVNLSGDANLPWTHGTSASNLMDIIEDRKIFATACNVFRGEKLCYLFVGRPAYKTPNVENPSTWQLPVAFVVRFHKPPAIKRIFPFDSGAFHAQRLPSYITMFKMGGYDLGNGGTDLIGRLISFYFKSPERYFLRQAATEDEIKELHNLDLRHAEIMALSRLYKEGSSTDLDDRAAAIELQIEQDLELKQENLLGLVMPREYSRVDGLMKDVHALTQNVELYDHLPLGTNSHYALLYEHVKAIYKKAGIRLGA